MKVTVVIDEDAAHELQAQTAREIEAVDQSMRQSFSGFDVTEIRPELERSLENIGVTLPANDLAGYAAAISARTDFVIHLG